nr:MAG TPA: hypothetical protein [Caudoviricetes sp.]DAY24817.1 MAG TPA: hypothetical protein [Caudoviricetes sp.]
MARYLAIEELFCVQKDSLIAPVFKDRCFSFL